MIIISLILIAVMISVTLISCSSEQNTGDKASTETATDENGNTIVVGTDENGETVIYETDEKGNVKGSQKYEAKGRKERSRKQSRRRSKADGEADHSDHGSDDTGSKGMLYKHRRILQRQIDNLAGRRYSLQHTQTFRSKRVRLQFICERHKRSLRIR